MYVAAKLKLKSILFEFLSRASGNVLEFLISLSKWSFNTSPSSISIPEVKLPLFLIKNIFFRKYNLMKNQIDKL